MKGKDLIHIGIFSAIYFVILFAVAMLGMIPIFLPLLSVIVPILGGIPFMLFLTRVKKFGMIWIMSIIMTAIKPFESSEVITLDRFAYSYGKQEALRIPKLNIPKGAVIAVIGHNGAGKSTFTKCLCGLQKHFQGKVKIDGKAYRSKDMLRLSYMVMQDVNHQLFAETVLEEVMLGIDDSGEQTALDILQKLNISEYKDRHPMSLSGGQKQRTAIASALLAGKKLLVFDEPTSGLNFRSMECTAELLSSLDKDITVLIVTYDMELIERCCTHILHMEDGKL